MDMSRASFVALGFAIAVSSWAGPSPVGSWKGRVVFDSSKMTLKDPNQVHIAKQQIAATEKLQIALTIKADKSFTGSPPPTSGTWTMKGNQLILAVKGKPGSQIFVLSKDGKTLTNTLPARQGISAKIVLQKSG